MPLIRNSYTALDKWRAIKMYENEKVSMDDIANKFNITKGMFSCWYANRDKIRDAHNKSRSIGSGRKAAHPDMEAHVAGVVKLKCRKRLMISGKQIK